MFKAKHIAFMIFLALPLFYMKITAFVIVLYMLETFKLILQILVAGELKMQFSFC